jgi:hypothetical protein
MVPPRARVERLGSCTPAVIDGRAVCAATNGTLRLHGMGRIYRPFVVGKNKFHCLFDSGARNTFVTPRVAASLHREKLARPHRSALGGKISRISEACILAGTIERRSVETMALVIPAIGEDEMGREIDILFGALAMQQWSIRLVLDEERLDMSHYPTTFVEFREVTPATQRARSPRPARTRRGRRRGG